MHSQIPECIVIVSLYGIYLRMDKGLCKCQWWVACLHLHHQTRQTPAVRVGLYSGPQNSVPLCNCHPDCSITHTHTHVENNYSNRTTSYRKIAIVCVCVYVYLSLSCAQLLLLVVGGVLFWVSNRVLVLRGGSLFTGILPSTSANQP